MRLTNDRSFVSVSVRLQPGNPSYAPPMLTDAELGLLEHTPDALLGDHRPEIRRLAIARCGDQLASGADMMRSHLEAALGSESATDRVAAAEALGRGGADGVVALLAACDDAEPMVVEAIATALGEIENPAAVPWLIERATSSGESMVREAAVAALGAIGDVRAIDPLLELVVDGPPQVRRRSVVALTVFDDPRIEGALRAATQDRNPMVREVAEMVVGHEREWTTLEIRE